MKQRKRQKCRNLPFRTQRSHQSNKRKLEFQQINFQLFLSQSFKPKHKEKWMHKHIPKGSSSGNHDKYVSALRARGKCGFVLRYIPSSITMSHRKNATQIKERCKTNMTHKGWMKQAITFELRQQMTHNKHNKEEYLFPLYFVLPPPYRLARHACGARLSIYFRVLVIAYWPISNASSGMKKWCNKPGKQRSSWASILNNKINHSQKTRRRKEEKQHIRKKNPISRTGQSSSQKWNCVVTHTAEKITYGTKGSISGIKPAKNWRQKQKFVFFWECVTFQLKNEHRRAAHMSLRITYGTKSSIQLIIKRRIENENKQSPIQKLKSSTFQNRTGAKMSSVVVLTTI